MEESRIEILEELKTFDTEKDDSFPFATKEWLSEISTIREEVQAIVVKMTAAREDVII